MSDLKHMNEKQLRDAIRHCQRKIAYHQSHAEGQKVRLMWAKRYLVGKEKIDPIQKVT